ncbi:N-formylglutamate amidohydrolase [Nereida sp. MMG025]|uniref:N-formylglutamate amidohydrolase n=1 Tax=Nereida sp. MMG025 TaxID=2909981 RepID=UPI001F36509B|nr:N-formylglutamate amidohydrolase [Nereida sp. MMG025]MCF6444333.1 N-formylglutamate amidohydrolase [Nereida sp. MMG025]
MTYSPYEIHGENRKGQWLITCDHATNTVPPFVNGGDLGLPAADMNRHIAYDVGALGVCQVLGDLLGSPVIASNFSRLVIDPNRGEDDPTLLMRLYDGTLIPANRRATADDLNERLERCYRPYHRAYAGLAAQENARAILAIHSFTPQLAGRPKRPWEIGVLYTSQDTRLAHPLLERLSNETDLTIGDNQPYSGHLPGDAIDTHALKHGRANILIEIRNDLIETPDDQSAWAHRLAPILEEVLTDTTL